MTTFPALEQLFRLYLHEDWADDGDDVWDVIDDYARSDDQAPLLGAEVEVILAAGPTETALRHLVLKRLSSGYAPDEGGLTFREWLTAVAARVEQVLNER